MNKNLLFHIYISKAYKTTYFEYFQFSPFLQSLVGLHFRKLHYQYPNPNKKHFSEESVSSLGFIIYKQKLLV